MAEGPRRFTMASSPAVRRERRSRPALTSSECGGVLGCFKEGERACEEVLNAAGGLVRPVVASVSPSWPRRRRSRFAARRGAAAAGEGRGVGVGSGVTVMTSSSAGTGAGRVRYAAAVPPRWPIVIAEGPEAVHGAVSGTRLADRGVLSGCAGGSGWAAAVTSRPVSISADPGLAGWPGTGEGREPPAAALSGGVHLRDRAARGDPAVWERVNRRVWCLSCAVPIAAGASVDPGPAVLDGGRGGGVPATHLPGPQRRPRRPRPGGAPAAGDCCWRCPGSRRRRRPS